MSKEPEIKTVGTVDLTPTWRGVLRIYLEAYAHGNGDGRAAAIKELNRMADIADTAMAAQKELPEYRAWLERRAQAGKRIGGEPS